MGRGERGGGKGLECAGVREGEAEDGEGIVGFGDGGSGGGVAVLAAGCGREAVKAESLVGSKGRVRHSQQRIVSVEAQVSATTCGTHIGAVGKRPLRLCRLIRLPQVHEPIGSLCIPPTHSTQWWEAACGACMGNGERILPQHCASGESG